MASNVASDLQCQGFYINYRYQYTCRTWSVSI